MISQAVTQAMASAGRPQVTFAPLSPMASPGPSWFGGYWYPDLASPPRSGESEASEYAEYAHTEGQWSDNEEAPSEAPPLVGLFNPSFFPSLLRKACTTGKMGLEHAGSCA